MLNQTELGTETILEYPSAFYFERNFDVNAGRKWLFSNTYICYISAVAYLLVILVGRIYMRSQKAYDLRTPFLAWNLMLSLFAIFGVARTMPEMIHVLKTHGFTHSVCNGSHFDSNVAYLWFVLMAFSKVAELMDTVFIVLRKKPLIFLHWYHHVTVLLYTWFAVADTIGPMRYFVLMNFCVHSMMYSYYTLRTWGVKVPTKIALVITTSQILQMVFGLFIGSYAYFAKWSGISCDYPEYLARYTLIMYFTYLILFVNFFYRAYISPHPRQKIKQK